ncbi:flagellar hook-length control protein FliK [Nitratireductor soli]|uniref:flagellar hook-length control protein FliK n=1 Tax=Nitratireductor soli TaxID=1670619 RepID=UPI00065DC76C|nr:flagellar hook-length control protein FliK [Nitratireductor soli]
MNAVLGSAMPTTPQGHETNARLRNSAAPHDTGFREALDGKGKADKETLPVDAAAPEAKRPGLVPVRWSLPHPVHQTTGKAAARGDAEDEGNGAKDDADAESLPADLPDDLPGDRHTQDIPHAVGAGPVERTGAEVLPAPTAQADAKNPQADGELAPGSDPGKRSSAAAQGTPMPGQPAMPAAPMPPANQRARENAASASMLNRQGTQPSQSATTPTEIRAETFRQRGADASGKAEIPANAMRPETRAAQTAQETLPRDGQGEIRVLSIQRAPAPVAAGEQAAAGQKSATPETAQTQLPTQSEAGRVLQTLKIQLHPAELGPVTARLRIVADQLMVDIQVETAEARHRLGSDSDAIVKALRGLGYDIDRVTVQQAAPGTPSSGTGTGNARDGAFQSAANGQDGGDPSRGAGRDERQDHPGRQGGPSQDSGDAPGSGLYI